MLGSFPLETGPERVMFPRSNSGHDWAGPQLPGSCLLLALILVRPHRQDPPQLPPEPTAATVLRISSHSQIWAWTGAQQCAYQGPAGDFPSCRRSDIHPRPL